MLWGIFVKIRDDFMGYAIVLYPDIDSISKIQNMMNGIAEKTNTILLIEETKKISETLKADNLKLISLGVFKSFVYCTCSRFKSEKCLYFCKRAISVNCKGR